MCQPNDQDDWEQWNEDEAERVNGELDEAEEWPDEWFDQADD